MGEVWRALDTDTDRVVAIKLLPAALAADSTFVQRFRREAYAAAKLNNPHIIPIHNYGEIEGRLYVDMRMVEGRDLQGLLNEGPLEPARAVAIIEQVAKALASAHKSGVIHRDVKPSNILVDEDDFAYLIDFGIARAADATDLTGTGATIGTWAYMAPERFQTGAADAKVDVYALACVLHQCLTGDSPFPGTSLPEQMHAHIYLDRPRPSQQRPGISPGFDKVIARGMAIDADQRYATTTKLASAARDVVITTARTPRANPASPSNASSAGVTKSSPPKAAPAQASLAKNDAKTAVPKASLATRPAKARNATTPVTKAKPPVRRNASADPHAKSLTVKATFKEDDTGRPFWQWLPWIAIVASVAVVGILLIVWRPWQRQTPPGPTKSSEALTSSSPIPLPPSATTTPPPLSPPTFSPKAIDRVLLTADQLSNLLGASVTSDPASTGGGGVVLALNSSSYGMPDHSGQVTPKSCVGVVFTGEHDVYAASQPTEIKTQVFGNLYRSTDKGPHLIEQTAAVYPTTGQAQDFLASALAQWTTCAKGEVDATLGYENGAGYTLGKVQRQGDLITVAMATNGALNGPDACQQALGAYDNVIVESRTCQVPNVVTNYDPTTGWPTDPRWAAPDAERVAKAMLANVKP